MEEAWAPEMVKSACEMRVRVRYDERVLMEHLGPRASLFTMLPCRGECGVSRGAWCAVCSGVPVRRAPFSKLETVATSAHCESVRRPDRGGATGTKFLSLVRHTESKMEVPSTSRHNLFSVISAIPRCRL